MDKFHTHEFQKNDHRSFDFIFTISAITAIIYYYYLAYCKSLQNFSWKSNGGTRLAIESETKRKIDLHVLETS